MRLNVNLNPPQPRAQAQDLMMIGRPGRPVMMQRFVANKMNGMGDHYHLFSGANRTSGAYPLSGLGADQAYNPGTGNIYKGVIEGTSSPPNATVGYQGPLILTLDYKTRQGFSSLPPVPSPYYWAVSQPYINVGVSDYYYIVMGPYGPAFTMPGNPPVLPLSAAASMSTVQHPITNPGVTTNAQNPNATIAIVTGGGSGTQGGGSNVLTAAPVAGQNTLPNSQSTIQTANTTGTSGQATGNLVNGLPGAGSNINPELLTIGGISISPLMLGAAALLLLVMVNK